MWRADAPENETAVHGDVVSGDNAKELLIGQVRDQERGACHNTQGKICEHQQRLRIN